MTDLSTSHPQSATGTGKPATAVVQLIALFQAVCSPFGQASAEQVRLRAARRAPEEILAAQARREEARRATDRLWLGR